MKRRFLALSVLLSLFLSLVPAATATYAADGPDYDIPNGHFYTQANGGAGANGFAVSDDGGIPMWTWFKRYGGVDLLGYPNTGRFTLDGFTVQGTQRVLLQWRPDTQTMAFVNIFDRLHDNNLDNVLTATFQIPPPIDNAAAERGINTTTKAGFDQVAALREAWLNFPNPAFRTTYFANPFHVDHFGLPTSQIQDFGPFLSIRLQRRAFQLWKADGPAGIKAGQLVEVLGSDIAKQVNYYPKEAATPSAPPSGSGPVTTTTSGTPTTGFAYGFQGEFQSGHAPQAIGAVKSAGFGWIKQQVRWEFLQGSGPTQGINWGELETVANTAQANGIKVLFSVCCAPGWAAVSGGHFPARPAEFATLMSTMASRFKGRVHAYEVWNEENYALEVGRGQINPASYVEMLKLVYPAIKAADPNAIVVTGAPTPTGVNDQNIAVRDMTYLQQMYAYQGGIVKNYFDALGAHNEPYANPPEEYMNTPHVRANYNNDPSFFFRQAEDYRNLMVQNGDGNKQIWETEIGYDSNPTTNSNFSGWTVTEQEQADYMVRLFKYARTNYPWMGAIFVWNLNFQEFKNQGDASSSGDEIWGFGVMRKGYTPRPAYTALAAMPKT